MRDSGAKGRLRDGQIYRFETAPSEQYCAGKSRGILYD
jgi:hypothetical protein